MIIPKRKRRNKLIFEVIPLIDVMMILAIFFAILAFLPQIQSSVSTKLPKASSAEKVEESLVVSINASGTIFLEDNPVSKNELVIKLKEKIRQKPGQPVLLAADESLSYDKVISVIDMMKSSGVADLGLVTEE